MRCSFSEARLDPYVEGLLNARERALVAEHVESCSHCAALLEELRVIDALLLQPRALEPAPNFTFKVMADVRSGPLPHVRRVPALAVLGTYLAFAWVTLGAFFLFARGAALATFAYLGAWFARTGSVAESVGRATGHVFGRHTFDVTATMSGVLAADVVAAGGVFALYTVLRSRRAAAERVVDRC